MNQLERGGDILLGIWTNLSFMLLAVALICAAGLAIAMTKFVYESIFPKKQVYGDSWQGTLICLVTGIGAWYATYAIIMMFVNIFSA